MKKKLKNIKIQPLFNRLPNNEGEWLELCMQNTERTISLSYGKEKEMFIEQLNRFKKQLKEWRKNENKN